MKKTLILTFLVLVLSLAFASAGDVAISPSNPDSGDNLVADVSGSGTYDYYWYEDGDFITSDMNTQESQLSASYTDAGELWTVKVYVPATAFTSSYYLGSDSVTVQGGDDPTEEPDATVYITPSNPYDADDLNCEVSDSEATYDFYWYVESSQIEADKNVKSSVLDADETEEGKTYTCKVYVPATSMTSSFYLGSDSVTVQEDEDDTNPWDDWDLEPWFMNFPPVLDPIDDITVYAGETVDVTAYARDFQEDDMTFEWDIPAGMEDATISNPNSIWSLEVTPVVIDYFGTENLKNFEAIMRADVVDLLDSNDVEMVLNPDIDLGNDYVHVVVNPDVLDIYNTAGYFDDYSEAESRLFWATEEDDLGSYDVTVTVYDEHGASDSETFTIYVIEEITPNQAPVLDHIDDIEIDEGEITYVHATATDADDDELTYSWEIDGADGALTWFNWFYWHTDMGDAGLYTITVIVTDGQLSDSETFEIKVNDLCEDENDDGECDEPVASNYEGDKLEAEEITVLNAASLGSAYEFTDATGVIVTGDYQLEGNVLTSKNTDNEVHVSITMLNKNSFDARDLQVTFILAGERSYSTFQDLDRSEESSAIYKVEIPNNLETGKYALQVIIENDDIYNEEFINLEIESLGDVVVVENPEDNETSFWQSLWDFF
ncbi:hypothetical protein HOD38_02895 [archaeon]|jgi:hypothetical protein|nr:hypothetical protein [archaeon]MBT4397189.1 hypothetical protein [archaeon]MBT4440569.1 hypothetical protein [archaeon]